MKLSDNPNALPFGVVVERLRMFGVVLHREAAFKETHEADLSDDQSDIALVGDDSASPDEPCGTFLFELHVNGLLVPLPWPATDDDEMVTEDLQRHLADRLGLTRDQRMRVFGWAVFRERRTPQSTPTQPSIQRLAQSVGRMQLLVLVAGLILGVLFCLAMKYWQHSGQ